MKKVIIILAIALLTSVNVYALTAKEVQKDITKATKSVIKVYKENGMQGLKSLTEDCYDKVKKDSFYCVYIDLASRYIDQFMIEVAAQNGVTFPKTEFFDDALFGERISVVFEKANMDNDASNKYLRNATPVINKMVEKELLKD